MKGNEIAINGAVAHVSLNKSYTAIIDSADVDKVRQYTWAATESKRLDGSVRTVYVSASIKKQDGKSGNLHLHRFLLDPPDDKHVDHKNGDGLDNRRSNIRLATRRQNSCNSYIQKRNTTGFKGVTFDRDEKQWMAQISVDGIQECLGYFGDDRVRAAKAYDEAARIVYGAFARLNFPNPGEQPAHRPFPPKPV